VEIPGCTRIFHWPVNDLPGLSPRFDVEKVFRDSSPLLPPLVPNHMVVRALVSLRLLSATRLIFLIVFLSDTTIAAGWYYVLA